MGFSKLTEHTSDALVLGDSFKIAWYFTWAAKIAWYLFAAKNRVVFHLSCQFVTWAANSLSQKTEQRCSASAVDLLQYIGDYWSMKERDQQDASPIGDCWSMKERHQQDASPIGYHWKAMVIL